jgi:pectate lyase
MNTNLSSPSLLWTSLALLAAQAVPAADLVNVRGFVVDGGTNAPLAGAKVELKTNGLGATTSSAGYYELKQASGVLSRQAADLASSIRLAGQILSFTVPEGASANLDIAAARPDGRTVSLLRGAPSAGRHALDLARLLPTPGVYLVRASYGGLRDIRTLRVVHDGRSLRAGQDDLAAFADRPLAARAAATPWDTLVASKTGYTTVKVALASALDSVPKIVLPPVVAVDSPIGYAMVDGTTTGGGSVAATVVKTVAEFKAAATDASPRVITVSGTINLVDAVKISSNKTIQGADKDAKLYGGIAMSGVNNVIVRNLNIQGVYPGTGAGDAVAVADAAHHIWIDHCNIWNAPDGNLDITKQASYVTVSWCKFWYTDASHDHRLNGLIGAGGGTVPADWGKLKVTYHHNWFADLIQERMPRLMYGQAHVYNNYYTATGNNECVAVGSYGAALVENNYFKNVKNPHVFKYDVYCDIVAKGNVYDNTTGTKNSGRGGTYAEAGQDFDVVALNTVPYTYTADAASNVPSLVSAGVGPK